MAVPGGMPSGKPEKKPRVKKKSTPVPGQTGAGSGPSPAKKPAVTRAPVTDVQSSGGDYGMKRAARAQRTKPVQVAQRAAYAAATVKQRQMVLKNATGSLGVNVRGEHERRRQLAEDRQHAAAQHDILTAQDIQKRDAYEKAHPIGSEYAKYVPNYRQGLAKAQGGGEFGKLTGLNVKKALDHIDNDAAEIAVTTPSSVAKLSSTLVHHPKKVPGMLVEPYKQLYKDPKNFIENHPVSAALMVSPAARLPGLGAGRIARLAGKQTLARTAATLPGTALKEARTGSRDFTIRQIQARKDAKTGTPVMSTKQIQKRTDEFFDVGQKHKQRVAISAKKEGQRRFADLPKAERKVALQEHVSGAKGDAREQVDKKFAEEFGSTWVNQPRAPTVRIRKVGEQKITVAHKVPPKAEYIAGRPKPARGTPDPTVEALSENIKPGKPGVAIESEHVRMVDPQTKAPVGFGRELPGSKVVVARDAQGKPIGVLKMILDQHDKPSVMEVAVDPAHRGKGIATSLVRTAHEAGYDVEAAAREGGLTEAGAALVHKNLAARAVEQPGATLHVGRYATEVTPRKGTVTLKKSGGKGVLHDNKADADAIAARVPFDAKVKQVGDKYAVVPKVAAERLYGGGKAIPHATVGTSGAIGAKVLRTAGKSFRTAVLPLSAKWLFGQAGEAGLRSVVAGAGPTSLLRESRVFKELERQAPGKGIEMRQRTSSGGQFGLQGTAREFANGRTLAEEFEGTGLEKPANVLTKGAAAPGIKHVRRGFRAYSHVVFNVVNDAIEKTAQRAMTGRALKQGPLMDHRIIGLSDKAIGEAAQGLRATENQVALGRAVDRMYGQYSKFSPGKRETLLHTTPFYPWYRNVVTFLTKVLPVDHPVLTGLIASTNVLEEDWRKKQGLSLLDPNHKPGFLLGGYPAKGGKVTRLSRYTPFGATADPLQGVADLAVPQFAGIRDNLKGLDWTGKPLKGNPLSNAGLTAAETHIPGVAQVDRVTGLGDKYVRKLDKPTILSGKDLKAALLKEVNPLMAAGAGSPSSTGPAVKVAPVRVKPVRVKPVRIKPVKVR